MLSTAFLALLSLAAPQAAAADELDALIERSRAIRAFTTAFEARRGDDVGMRVQIEAVLPDRMRAEFRGLGARSSMYFVDRTFTFVSLDESDVPVRGQVRWADIESAYEGAEAELARSFPDAKQRRSSSCVLQSRWRFDESVEKCQIEIQAAVFPAASPLGWLLELQRKSAEPTVDGDLLRFVTDDGHFQVAIDRTTGFLSELAGTSPQGSARLLRTALDLDPTIDPERFVAPSAPSSVRDVSADLTREFERGIGDSLRARIYAAAAGEDADGWDESEREKRLAVLRALHERFVPAGETRWREHVSKVALEFMEEQPPEEVERGRPELLKRVEEQADEHLGRILERLEPPELALGAPRARDLLSLERDVVAEIFAKLVREPVLREIGEAVAGER